MECMTRWEREDESTFCPDHARRWASDFSTPLFLERYRDFVLSHVPGAAASASTVDEAIEVVA